MKICLLITAFVGIFLLAACDEQDIPTNPEGIPNIKSFAPTEPVVFDTLSVEGEYFGIADEGKIVINDSITIKGNNCILWQYTLIKFIIPKNFETGEMFIISGKDTSNILEINIKKIPDLQTVEVPAGTFEMGSIASSVEMPVHTVNISKAFIIAKYEINQRVFETVMGYNPSSVKDWRLPADSIKWLEAVKFCNKLSNLYGLDSCYKITGNEALWDTNANGWRLPTEAEWEYACRAGTTTDFSGTGNLDDMGWYNENSGLKIMPGGLKNENDFGIYDMHGNLWEWCWDYYGRNYYETSPYENPLGPASGVRHVARGGSWREGLTFARSSNREIPSSVIYDTGIRVVRYNENN